MLKSSVVAAVLGTLATAHGFEIPEIDPAKLSFNYSGDMDFDNGPGSVRVSSYELKGMISKPIKPIDSLYILPMLEYKGTELEFNGIPQHDEDLHSISLSATIFQNTEGSKWIYAGYARVELASDFQHIDSDDFTYDLAAGVGYRFNDHFTLGGGVAVTNINGDTSFFPGINFDWQINEQFRMGIYGPTFVASYTPCPDWEFSVRADSYGNIWNITDTNGESHSYNLTSYRVGLYASRRLTGTLWLFAGGGTTFGNEIELATPSGDEFIDEDLKSSWYGQVGLRLKVW